MTAIMGVLNVTPDSFSDGGRWARLDDAVAHAVHLRDQGADLVDVGGESTRPGAPRVPSDAECERVLPVIRELADRGIPTSVDTMNASTAERAVHAGASWVNDVSGGLADPGMLPLIADLARGGVGYMLSHWRGHSAAMNSFAHYNDAAVDVRDEVHVQLDRALAVGVPKECIVLDPGLGFAKNHEHNWRILARLDVLAELGCPVLIGASRKRFLGALLPPDASFAERDLPTAVISALAAWWGAPRSLWGVRVHDVVSTRRALAVVEAWRVAAEGAPDSAPQREVRGSGSPVEEVEW